MSYEIQPNYEAEARIHNEQETKPPQKSHGCLAVIATMVIVAVINFIIIGIFVKPEATSEDINVRVGEVSILAVNIVITPKVNIDDFKIDIKFYDDKHNLIDTVRQSFGDVKKGQQYNLPITTVELLYQAIKTDNMRVYVSGKISIWSRLF